MSRPSADLLIIRNDNGTTSLACPGPGQVSLWRRPGEAVTAGSAFGVIVRDELCFRLVVPEGASGVIRALHASDRWNSCEHGQPLATLGPWSDELASASPEAADAADEGVLVRSPTHGTFYRRPSPEAPPFVEPGQLVRPGQTVGLVEVMKCFSPIAFEPPEGVGTARVVEMLADDGAEVRSGQPLIRLEPGGDGGAAQSETD